MAYVDTMGGFSHDEYDVIPPETAFAQHGPVLEPVSSIVGSDGEAQISLLTPTRLQEPAEFHAPPRASFPVHAIRTTTTIVNRMFARLKSSAR